ncbi:hypothetical protein [Neptuniibacter pectenicola]|uniref:hypothetical protein n=1 Tax=Neptuniibacter pectenicola TaxID=1806669 RepID=UPI0012E8D344|nr:hypothetical protein [Neptuniibacter pectenicola]
MAFAFIASCLVTGMAAGTEMSLAKESVDMDLYKKDLKNLKAAPLNAEGTSLINGMPSALAEHFISCLYGKVHESINLSPKHKELVLIAGLISMSATNQLTFHIPGA